MRPGLLLLMLLLACSSQKTPVDSHTLHVIVNTVPDSLDPRVASTEVASHMSELLFASLFTFGEDLLPKPYLAQSVQVVDPVTYRVTLRPGLFFHDDQKLEAKDVVATFSVASAKRDQFKSLESVQALSPLVVEFKLKKPDASFVSQLVGFGIMSSNAQSLQVGSGPYRLKSYNSATETWVFEAFEKWFEGKPTIQNIEIRVVRDVNTRLLELIKGKADLCMGSIRPFQLPALEKYRTTLRIEKTAGLGYLYVAMNLRKRPLSDVRVRQAIAHAIDVEAIMKAKWDGFSSRATGMLPGGHWAKDSELEALKYDPEASKRLLKEAGVKLPLHLEILTTTDRFRQSFALIYRHQLKQVGIEAEIRIQDWATAFANMKQGNFDLYSAMWTPVADPNLYEWIFHSSNIPGPDKAGGNRGAYVDPEVDRWIEEAQAVFEPKQRREIYVKIERRLLKTLPYIPLWFEDNIVVSNRRLSGFVPDRQGSFLPLTKAHLLSPRPVSRGPWIHGQAGNDKVQARDHSRWGT